MPLTQVPSGMLQTTAQYYGFKNRIINGAMTVSQYNGTNSVTLTTGVYFIDRYYTNLNPGSGHTGQQVTTVPNGNFINSVKLTVGTGGTATAAQQARFVQSIEGLNIYDLGWGTANAQSITLSFWVQSSITGTYPVGFANDSGAACYVGTYAISTANTWTYVTITVPGPTSGTWITSNNRGIKVAWGLGAGSNYNQAAGSWSYSGTDQYSVSGAANWIGTSGATFYITGVQLEAGSTATSFDYRPYGTELNLCQRYYETYALFYNNESLVGMCESTTAAYTAWKFVVTKRAAPTCATFGTVQVVSAVGSGLSLSSFSFTNTNPDQARINAMTNSASLVAGNATNFYTTTSTSPYGGFTASAEL